MSDIHSSWTPLFNNFKIKISEPHYPKKENIFKVYEIDVKDIRVVLIGQDPYHGSGQADGLAFSVPEEKKIPPSLVNIFKELQIEFPERNYIFLSGNLKKWFYNEKIFLLNSSLTVEPQKPGSHIKLWSSFTDATIKFISDNNPNCIFLLLGNFSKSKEKFIKDKSKIIYGVHPSPLSAYRGFFNSDIFKQVEEKLGEAINWST